jgi:hypothetical protein
MSSDEEEIIKNKWDKHTLDNNTYLLNYYNNKGTNIYTIRIHNNEFSELMLLTRGRKTGSTDDKEEAFKYLTDKKVVIPKNSYLLPSEPSQPPTVNESLNISPTKLSKARKIKKFITSKYKKQKEQSNALNIICADSGQCLALGKGTSIITRFFENFRNFKYVTQIKLLASGVNGFVIELKCNKMNYNSYSILKSSKSAYSDNLYYEYIVGKEINKHFLKFFPCFLETYQLLKYKNPDLFKNFREKYNKTRQDLNDVLEFKQNITLDEICLDSKYISILIQHINGGITLDEFMNPTNEFYVSRITKEILPILFQVYYALSILSDKFTHYDLHEDNILLYQPYKGNNYIHYFYHLPNGDVIDFYSSYIVKIIDYGRSYINTQNSISINKLNNEPNCINTEKPNDFSSKGFSYFSDALVKEEYYISSLIRNKSHDLRLLQRLFELHWKKLHNLPSYKYNLPNIQLFIELLQSVYYEPIVDEDESEIVYFGTPEFNGNNTTHPLYRKNKQQYNSTLLPTDIPNTHLEVFNVEHAFNKICDLIQQSTNKTEDFNRYNNVGEIHIYGLDKPIEYKPGLFSFIRKTKKNPTKKNTTRKIISDF